MNSWQSHLISLMLRWRVKHRPSTDENEFVRGARRLFSSPKLVPQITPPDVSLDEVSTKNVRGEWIVPTNDNPKNAIIYFHGGGYISGSVKTYRATTFALARIARTRVFAVEYRLAPEYRFPCAVEDGLAAYKYVLEQCAAKNIGFVGDSAGGGLLLATMLAAREANLPLPRAGICYSPFTDLATTGASLVSNNQRCAMFYGDSLRIVAPIYLGAADARNPLASPLYADLRGLPPLQIFASSSETLLDDSLRLAEKATAAGVSVDLQVWKNLPHVWAIFAERLPEARRTLRMTADFFESAAAESR